MDVVWHSPGLGELWRIAAGGDPAIRLAIIDGPVDLDHPSLQGALVEAWMSAQDNQSVGIRSEHGTHVASIILGQPGSPVLGVAPHCSAGILPIYRETVDGHLEPTSQIQVARAINAAVERGADIISISSGQLSPTGKAERVLADAVRRCCDAKRLIVASAGNDGCRCLHVPAALDGVLAVGACDLAGRPLPFSNFGQDYLKNGLLAPGQDITGAASGGGSVERTGTSYATPIVSGIIALFLSLMRRHSIEGGPQAVRNALLSSALPCEPDTSIARCLAGRLNIEGAARILLGPLADISVGADAPIVFPTVDTRPGARPTPQTTPSNRRMEGAMSESATITSTSPRSNPDSAGVVPADASESKPASAATSVDAVGNAAAAVETPAAGATPAQAAAMPTMPGYAVLMPPIGAPWFSSQPGGHQFATQGLIHPSGSPMLAGTPPMASSTDFGADAVRPSEPQCGCQVRPAQADTDVQGEKVFAIGRLFYDFGSEARLDYFVYEIASWRDSLEGRGDPSFGPNRDRAGDIAAPYNPEIMVRFLLNLVPGEDASPTLMQNLPNANALIWTLNIDGVPIYALDPKSVYGSEIFRTYILVLWYQEVSREDPTKVKALVSGTESVKSAPATEARVRFTRVSQAGEIVGTVTLLNGTLVPTLAPAWRGTYTWDLEAILGEDESTWHGADAFLERIYNEFRNVGQSPQDRALNYSAMNARQTRTIFAQMAPENMQLDLVEVDRSSICRPESDCWDVTYRFFNPTAVLTHAREVFQHTIDVSDIVPVPVGKLRRWQVA